MIEMRFGVADVSERRPYRRPRSTIGMRFGVADVSERRTPNYVCYNRWSSVVSGFVLLP